MDKTPKGKSFRFVRSYDNKQNSHHSPTKEAKKQRFCFPDADFQDNDVSWDWNSPKNIKPKALRVKKMDVSKSPILAPKKTSQLDHMKNYERLKQELQALRDEIARSDDCVPLSPIDEQIFKEENSESEINSFIEEQYFHIENQEEEACIKTESKQTSNNCYNESVGELFDDDCDEQLLLCTQIIEDKLDMMNKTRKDDYRKIVNNTDEKNNNNRNNLNPSVHTQKKSIITTNKTISNNLASSANRLHIDDSFDAVLVQFEDEDIDILTQSAIKNTSSMSSKFQNNRKSLNSIFKRTVSDANVQYSSQKLKNSNFIKSDFQRTHSFESTSTVRKEDDLPKHVMEEIEKKRKEALARLMDKKGKSSPITPTPCSLDEIEKKRLRAKAIREAKQREIIEKNRQEAMRRLEISKRKKIENSKSSVKNLL